LDANRRGPESWTTATARTFGEFRGQARLISAGPVRPGPNEAVSLGDADGDGDDNELGRILSAIAEEVHRVSAAACAGVMAEFAGRMQHARKSFPRGQVPGVLHSLKEARDAALAIIKRNAAAELAGRRETATKAHGNRLRSVRGGQPHLRRKSPEGPIQK
jgi:hypothetical protein